jgi:ArsR family transcriptional regulator
MSRRIYKIEKEPGLEIFFRALADRTRLRLLNLMRDREVCVCYFVEILKMSQPKVSRHLAYLRRAGIAAARRQGTWMHYRIVIPRDGRMARLLGEVLEALRADREMLHDRTRLEQARSAPDTLVALPTAPPPAPILRA